MALILAFLLMFLAGCIFAVSFCFSLYLYWRKKKNEGKCNEEKKNFFRVARSMTILGVIIFWSVYFLKTYLHQVYLEIPREEMLSVGETAFNSMFCTCVALGLGLLLFSWKNEPKFEDVNI